MDSEIASIPLGRIHEPWCLLRPVLPESIEFIELCDSIREHGLLNSISVRPSPRQEGMYELIDGMWRFYAHKELDIPEICAIIKYGITDEEVLGLQIAANSVSFETKPLQFAMQMKRLINIHEDMGTPLSLAALGKMVGKSASWVGARLKLLELAPEVQKAFEKGEITLAHATAIGHIRKHKYQLKFLPFALGNTGRATEIEIGRWLRKVREDKDAYRREEIDTPKLTPHIRRMDALLQELDTMQNVASIIVAKGLTSPLEGAKAMLEWVLHLDDQSRKVQLEKWKFRLTYDERRAIIAKQRYAELSELRELREKRAKRSHNS